MNNMKAWIEAMRLRTLPVSLSGVIIAVGYNLTYNNFRAVPATLCLIFALLAQIASNFANEYYDFKGGLDRKGREGPRRGVTEGDITPEAMKRATFATLAMACITGLGLVFYGGWWLIPVGVFIALGVLAYSTGPYPLSHHGLGELAVFLFFGIIPVNLTYYVQALEWSPDVFIGSVSAGLMGANVLIVNNYRDIDDDRIVGKRTLAVKTGRRFMSWLYLMSGVTSMIIVYPFWVHMLDRDVPAVAITLYVLQWLHIRKESGRSLNPRLGSTAGIMMSYALSFVIFAALL